MPRRGANGFAQGLLDQIRETKSSLYFTIPVKLVLTHENLADSKDARVGMLAGWHTHLDILVYILNGMEPKSFWPAQMMFETDYEARV